MPEWALEFQESIEMPLVLLAFCAVVAVVGFVRDLLGKGA